MSRRILLVVSALTANAQPATRGPRKDYAVLADKLAADILDRGCLVGASRFTRLLSRAAGPAVAQAWLAFRKREAYDAIVTDGEHIGIPLACLLKVTRARTAHVTIGHRITAPKKWPFFRLLRVHTQIDRVALHSRRQYELGVTDLQIPQHQLALVPYQVDTHFWRPSEQSEQRVICSAGLEFRDYPTLVQAVDGLDVQLVIGAASHWSKRRNTAQGGGQPSNVVVDAFDYQALRDLYARSSIVVVPLDDTDFQAGVTTILEAMSMGKPVIVTHSQGQTDVVEDRRQVTRGEKPRDHPTSLLRIMAERAGVDLEPNGFYVPPSDPGALRRAIVYLLDHPDERRRLGAAGRRAVERLMTIEQFAARMQALVDDARSERQQPVPGRRTSALVEHAG